jgi:endoglucanase
VDDAGEPDEPDEPLDGVGIVGQHGRLRVKGNRVVDQRGQPIQLRGMSWFWSQWTDFYVAKNVDVMVDDWKATLVRAALGVENDGGYLQNPQANVAKVRTLVDRAIERGVYVIIDWHDHHAQDHKAQAISFFREMAQTYGKEPHVIFEIYNEPMNVSWPVVKAYAEDLIRTIRDAGSNNLIIVGTPTWSQDVDVAANDRITSDDNVAYTLHFYANTHRQQLRDKAKAALDRGVALFVTEWGTCSADGNGSIDENETRTWLSFLRDHSISWANWALNNKAEACSAIQPSAPATGPWRDDQLTSSGRLVKGAIP